MSAATPSLVDALASRSARSLAALALGALLAGLAVARLAPNWWLMGVLAFGMTSGALAASAQQWRARIRARGASGQMPLILVLSIYRTALSALAIASVLLFVLMGLALTIGSIGVGG